VGHGARAVSTVIVIAALRLRRCASDLFFCQL